MLGIDFNREAVPDKDDIYILFAPDQSDLILLEWDGKGAVFPTLTDLQTTELSYIGSLENRSVWSGYLTEILNNNSHLVVLDNSEESNSFNSGQRFLIKLRKGFELLEEKLYVTACRASVIAYWRRRARFCGGCGSKLQLDDEELAMFCSDCGEKYYPQIAPAIIVAIRRDERILMVKSKRSLSSFYGLIAGYVEAGETLEEAVHREVREESNLEIKNVKYVKSQSWPFPNSQMFAFTADYKSGELRIQEEELIDAQWFNAGEIPPMPPRLSIGGYLIEEFRRKMG